MVEILGKPNYTEYEDTSKVGASWLFEDHSGNQYSIWRYKVAATYAVFAEDKEFIQQLFNGRIQWMKQHK